MDPLLRTVWSVLFLNETGSTCENGRQPRKELKKFAVMSDDSEATGLDSVRRVRVCVCVSRPRRPRQMAAHTPNHCRRPDTRQRASTACDLLRSRAAGPKRPGVSVSASVGLLRLLSPVAPSPLCPLRSQRPDSTGSSCGRLPQLSPCVGHVALIYATRFFLRVTLTSLK